MVQNILEDENVKLIKAEPLTTSIATVDVRDASPEGLALMKQRVGIQKEMIRIAISLTSSSQWTLFGESVYPTGGAADTILRRAFGLTWSEKIVEVIDGENGPEAICKAWLMQAGQKIEQFTGRRAMGGFVKTEADLIKGSIENMKSVAVRDLLGLRFRTAAELREMGLDVGKLQRRVDFQQHDDTSAPDSGVAVVPFGKNKGKAVTELSEKQLDWYTDTAKENVSDPAKEKYRAKEQKWLDALLAEKARRQGGNGKQNKGEFDFGPPPIGDEEMDAGSRG